MIGALVLLTLVPIVIVSLPPFPLIVREVILCVDEQLTDPSVTEKVPPVVDAVIVLPAESPS